jgi:hypothetical protein
VAGTDNVKTKKLIESAGAINVALQFHAFAVFFINID